MHKNRVLAIATIISITTILVSVESAATLNVTAQPGTIVTSQNKGSIYSQYIIPTYAVSIVPGAAQRDSTYHYYPPAIAIPVHTTVAWFNNDFGQAHTVTSGAPGAPNSMFNSGLMPATSNSLFQYTFDHPGDFSYYCVIHPWRMAAVSVSDSVVRGSNFELTYGTGPVWNFSKDFRTLISLEPRTVPLDRITPLVYNITIYVNGAAHEDMIFSKTFVTSGEKLPLELIRGENQTIAYGPDFTRTGAYHIEGPIFTENGNYTIKSEISAINGMPPENAITDEFSLRTVT